MRTLSSLLLVLFAGLASCTPGKFAGGGTLPSAVSGSRQPAAFGFIAEAFDTTGDGYSDTARGELQYVDQSAGYRVHVSDFVGTNTGGPTQGPGQFQLVATYDPVTGESTSHDPQSGDRAVQVVVDDFGEPGIGDDFFQIFDGVALVSTNPLGNPVIEVTDPYRYVHIARLRSGNLQRLSD